ncbi:MAG: tetratricopeptide repeat protein [Chloroflexi bacterium]|nr:tetratricopeptide repeat protein [Chloroflexota bacterium]
MSDAPSPAENQVRTPDDTTGGRPSNHRNHRLGLTQRIVTGVLPAIAIVLALFAIWLWYTETREETHEPVPVVESEDAVLAQANLVLDRANDAVNSAELVLSFLEGASVIITIVIAIAAIVGLSSISELRETVDDAENELLKRVEEAEARLLARERQLANMEDLLAEAEARIDRLIEERLERVYQDTESARRESRALARHSLAEQLLREKNIDAALHACEEAYKLDPHNHANNYLYGMLFLEKGEYDTAITRLEEALEIEPNFPAAIAALGLAHRRAGDLQDDRRRRNEYYNVAEARLLEAMEKDPMLLTHDGESYYGTLGSLYRRQGRIEDALDSYRRAAEATPRRSYPYLNLAMLYMQQSEDQLRDQNLLIAERNATRRLADTPTDYWALYDIALIRLIRSEADGAKQAFKEAIELTPAAVSTYYSVVARLTFLQSFMPDMAGLTDCSDMLDAQIKRFSTR